MHGLLCCYDVMLSACAPLICHVYMYLWCSRIFSEDECLYKLVTRTFVYQHDLGVGWEWPSISTSGRDHVTLVEKYGVCPV